MGDVMGGVMRDHDMSMYTTVLGSVSLPHEFPQAVQLLDWPVVCRQRWR